ncbi:hypothetical protein [Curtobacterium sp. MCBA15_001]|uniref:hypothetical protein n=1 Tax=Curtobacterium sp. MCBA15_001 TaxID=1898731 RepID=UPI001113373E|nr:hypothetical protein [Curtobacterium sp. MCBA15_001]
MLHDGLHDGWCDDCDSQTVVVDRDDASDTAWATCTECGAGWVHRDDVRVPAAASAAARPAATERRAA